MKNITIKSQLIIYLALFASYLSVIDKGISFLLAALLATASATAIESGFTYIRSKKLLVTESSVISGLIIGHLLASDNPWWVFVLASFAAISSKYLLRFRGRHIFNPAGIGVFLSTLLFHVSTQWKGTYLWYILAPAGIYFIWKIKKQEVLYGYFFTALVLFGAQALLQRTPLGNIFGYFSYFYIFIMLIEPKTSPLSRRGKIIFGSGTAVLIFILTQIGIRFDVELFSLLVMNAFVPALNKIKERSAA